MKKTYEAPKVEKMEFDYSEVVVASQCRWEEPMGDTGYQPCRERPIGPGRATDELTIG